MYLPLKTLINENKSESMEIYKEESGHRKTFTVCGSNVSSVKRVRYFSIVFGHKMKISDMFQLQQ